MDIVITFVIILVIVMAVAPFFLLSGEFGAKKPADDGTGTVTPVPGTGDSPVFPKNTDDSGAADAADAEDGADDDHTHHM